MKRVRTNILITGASAGLGRGMAREFARKGRNLALCARRLDQLQELRAELLLINPNIRVCVAALDVGEHDRVFEVFRSFQSELGGLDRIVVNAGVGKGQPIGTGRFEANLRTAQINFVAALAQCEAAMELFRAQGHGHLVNIASMSAFRGQTKNRTTYAATKAGFASLSRGIQLEMRGTMIKVSTIYPGFILTDLVKNVKTTFAVDEKTGCLAMVNAIEREVSEACVPWWPWTPVRFFLRAL